MTERSNTLLLADENVPFSGYDKSTLEFNTQNSCASQVLPWNMIAQGSVAFKVIYIVIIIRNFINVKRNFSSI